MCLSTDLCAKFNSLLVVLLGNLHEIPLVAGTMVEKDVVVGDSTVVEYTVLTKCIVTALEPSAYDYIAYVAQTIVAFFFGTNCICGCFYDTN